MQDSDSMLPKSIWVTCFVLTIYVYFSCFVSFDNVSESIFKRDNTLLLCGLDFDEITGNEIKRRICLLSYGLGLFMLIPYYFSEKTGWIFHTSLNPFVSSAIVQLIAMLNITHGDSEHEVISYWADNGIRKILLLFKGCNQVDIYQYLLNSSTEYRGKCNLFALSYDSDEENDIYNYYYTHVIIIKDIYRIAHTMLDKNDKRAFVPITNMADGTKWWVSTYVINENQKKSRVIKTGNKKIHYNSFNPRK